MIVDAILAVLLRPLSWVLSAVPTVSWPSWVGSGPGTIVSNLSTWGTSMGAVSTWFPVATLMEGLQLVFTVALITVGIRAVRLVVSLLTGGGGGAA